MQPLMVWMYRECYLRFSSQQYNLNNCHESIHLTNHAVQKKYSNHSNRDKRLPNDNMWDSNNFQDYLKQIGKHELWLDRIYPGIRKAIVATVLISQDHMERTSNTFELFGADFMICENYYPWLIEINSNPDLAPTTSVTARMCPQCLEDVIKGLSIKVNLIILLFYCLNLLLIVVIDRRQDPKADVGKFELIYRQVIPTTPAYMGLNLCVKGKQITGRTAYNSHFHSSISYQRKSRTMQLLQMQRRRTNLSLSTVSYANRSTMPAFNATDYLQRCISLSSNLKNSKFSLSVPTFRTKIPNNNRYPTSNFKQPPSARPDTNQLIANTIAIQIKSEKSVSTLKRHKSCGPCMCVSSTSRTRTRTRTRTRSRSRSAKQSQTTTDNLLNSRKENSQLNKTSLQLIVNKGTDKTKV